MGELLIQTHADAFADHGAFAAALAEAVRWMCSILFCTLHYLPPVDVTAPMIALLLVETDSHVFVQDDIFRNIARDVFARHNLWDTTLDFTPPSIGHELRDAHRDGPAHLSRTLLQHADTLRIPLGPHIRHRTSLVTTTRGGQDARRWRKTRGGEHASLSESGAGMDTLTVLTALEQKMKAAIERATGAVKSKADAGAHVPSTHVLRKDDTGGTQLMRAA